MMTSPGRRAFVLSALAALGLLGPRMAAAAPMTYIALGDSLTFGVGENDTATDISNGDRGFVKPFADTLASLNGGVRPNVINLGVSGTTSVSFFEGGGGIRSPQDALRNTNYSDTATTQNSLLLTTIAEEQAAGREIGYVTITLGSNDLFALAADPAFLAGTQAEQAMMLGQTLQTVATRISTLLVELEALAPAAHVLLLGTYNPYPAVPGHPLAGLAGLAISELNKVIEGLAAGFEVSYVDIYTPFVGNEFEYTYIGPTPNVHPNPLGYAVIAEQVGAVAAPEPSSLVLLGTGLLGVLGFGWRRRLAAA